MLRVHPRECGADAVELGADPLGGGVLLEEVGDGGGHGAEPGVAVVEGLVAEQEVRGGHVHPAVLAEGAREQEQVIYRALWGTPVCLGWLTRVGAHVEDVGRGVEEVVGRHAAERGGHADHLEQPGVHVGAVADGLDGEGAPDERQAAEEAYHPPHRAVELRQDALGVEQQLLLQRPR